MNQMNLVSSFLGRLLLLVVVAGSFGCTSETKTAGGGTSGTGISQGTISGFGSLFTNGIKFDTRNVTITIDGIPAMESDLRVGMVGTVIGAIDVTSSTTAIASTVDVSFNLVGRIDDIDLERNNLVVAGQPVVFNSLTVFQNGGPGTLRVGDFVAVSGLSSAGSSTIAGYIKTVTSPASNSTVITGVINLLDRNAETFQVGAQLVNFAPATFIDMGKSDLAEDLPIRVVGARNSSGVLEAKSVQNLAAKLIGKQNDIFILEGIADIDTTTNNISVSNNNILVTPATKFVNGEEKDILTNSRLSVRGRIIKPGTIEADQIEFAVSPNITIIGSVESVDPAANRVVVSGLTVTVNNSTRMLDVSTAKIQKFSLGNLRVGDQLTIYGYQTRSNIDALLLRRDSIASSGTIPNSSVTIRGLAGAAVADPFFDIGVTTVDTSGLSDPDSFLGIPLIPITRSKFFESLRGGAFVEARGTLTNQVLAATSVKLLGQSNMTLTRQYFSALGGVNDIVMFWDGSLNTEQDLANGTTFVNMFITSKSRMLTKVWNMHDIRVFGPGVYTFDTCAYQAVPLSCNLMKMTVGADQIGAHMLLDWWTYKNIYVINVWDKDKTYCTGMPSSRCAIHSVTADGVLDPELGLVRWNLVSTDNDNDGIPGVSNIDGDFSGLALNFNLIY